MSGILVMPNTEYAIPCCAMSLGCRYELLIMILYIYGRVDEHYTCQCGFRRDFLFVTRTPA